MDGWPHWLQDTVLVSSWLAALAAAAGVAFGRRFIPLSEEQKRKWTALSKISDYADRAQFLVSDDDVKRLAEEIRSGGFGDIQLDAPTAFPTAFDEFRREILTYRGGAQSNFRPSDFAASGAELVKSAREYAQDIRGSHSHLEKLEQELLEKSKQLRLAREARKSPPPGEN